MPVSTWVHALGPRCSNWCQAVRFKRKAEHWGAVVSCTTCLLHGRGRRATIRQSYAGRLSWMPRSPYRSTSDCDMHGRQTQILRQCWRTPPRMATTAVTNVWKTSHRLKLYNSVMTLKANVHPHESQTSSQHSTPPRLTRD